MHACIFLCGLQVALQIYSLINAKIFLVGSLIETMRLSALFANSLLHIYFILRYHLVSRNGLQLKNDKKNNLNTSKLNKDLSKIECFQCCLSVENSDIVSFLL